MVKSARAPRMAREEKRARETSVVNMSVRIYKEWEGFGCVPRAVEG